MNRLELDFAPRSARYWWARAGVVLRVALLVPALVLAAGLWWAMALHTERLQLQAAMPRAQSLAAQALPERTAQSTKGAQAPDAAQTQAMNQALLALNRPWSALWDALERVSNAPGVRVAILEMRPDAAVVDPSVGATQGLRLLAESKSSAQMLGFMRQLRAEPFFESAVLISHQVNAQDPNQPLRFEVTLRWAQASP